uniref:Uncharacterized protein n=1 Tax=Clostridium botulinum TaxID=1491 RepID=A0A140C307_CLOBO|nr:hypothetical protein [Clostridium botulinum]
MELILSFKLIITYYHNKFVLLVICILLYHSIFFYSILSSYIIKNPLHLGRGFLKTLKSFIIHLFFQA